MAEQDSRPDQDSMAARITAVHKQASEAFEKALGNHDWVLQEWQRPVQLGPFYEEVCTASHREVEDAMNALRQKGEITQDVVTQFAAHVGSLRAGKIRRDLNEIVDTLVALKTCQYLLETVPGDTGQPVAGVSSTTYFGALYSLFLNETGILHERVETFLKRRERELKKRKHEACAELLGDFRRVLMKVLAERWRLRSYHVHEARMEHPAVLLVKTIEDHKTVLGRDVGEQTLEEVRERVLLELRGQFGRETMGFQIVLGLLLGLVPRCVLGEGHTVLCAKKT